MSSISKAQARAIADGFLNALGTTKEGLQPRETLSEFVLLAGEMVEDMQHNLNQTNSNASGALSGSIAASEPVAVGGSLKIEIAMNEYGKYINKGVKGTKSGDGLYAFKYDNPSKKMVQALLAGINRATKATSNSNRAKTISRNEQKNHSISAISHAYAAGRNIKMYGIKANGFLDKAIVTTQGKVSERLGVALKIDVIDSLTQ